MKTLINKLTLSVTAILLLLICNVNAADEKFDLGVRFMPTVSSFDMKSSSGESISGDATIGLGFGAIFGYNFTEHFEIQMELIYSNIGQEFEEQDVKTQVNLAYINIPILFSYNTGKYDNINFNFVVGPQIGISVGADVSTTETGVGLDEAKVSVKPGDLGFAYGAGVSFGLNADNTFRLGAGFRGVYGLIDISDNSETIVEDTYYVLDTTNLITYSLYAGISWLF